MDPSGWYRGIPVSACETFRLSYWARVQRSDEYRAWRIEVFARDGHRCLMCAANNPLEAHHVYKRSELPERMFDVNNGATLCTNCHCRVTGQEMAWAPIFERLLAEAH